MERLAPRYRVALAMGVLGLLGLAGCGNNSNRTAAAGSPGPSATPSAASSCTGNPIRLMVNAPLTGPYPDPELLAGAKGAAHAENEACSLGRPIQIESCDNKFDPNLSTACARQSVTDNVLAQLGDSGNFPDLQLPILAKAGIPSVGGLATSAAEFTSPLVFPTTDALGTLVAGVTLAKSIGRASFEVVQVDLPGVTSFISLMKGQGQALGLTQTGSILVPADAVDMAQYAAQLVASKADTFIVALPASQFDPLVKALAQLGVNFRKTAMITFATVISAPDLARLGTTADGMYLVGNYWPVDDTSNAGIRQMLAGLTAAGIKNTDQADALVRGWDSVRLVTLALHGVATNDINSATLVTAFNKLPAVNWPESPSIDFGRHAYGSDFPAFAGFRLFSRQVVVDRFSNGKVTVGSPGFVDTLKPYAAEQKS